MQLQPAIFYKTKLYEFSYCVLQGCIQSHFIHQSKSTVCHWNWHKCKAIQTDVFQLNYFLGWHHLCYHRTDHFQLNYFSSTISPLLSSDRSLSTQLLFQHNITSVIIAHITFNSITFPAQHHHCYHPTYHFQLNDFSSTTSPLLSSDPGSDGNPQYKAKEATADEAKKSSGSKVGTVNVLRVFLRAFGLSFAIRQVCNRTNKRSKRRSCQNEMCVFMSVRDINIWK